MTSQGPELLTVDELAAELKVSRKTILNWRSQGVGPAGFRVGRAVRYRRDVVAQWLADQEVLAARTSA